MSLLAGALVALPTGPAAADQPPDTDPLLTAQTRAVDTGQVVPVDSLTSEVSTTDANPDGTFTSATSLLPVRVYMKDSWVPVDATLTLGSDGLLSPTATPNGVKLSNGGSGPLVTLTHGSGVSMSLSMPFSLPTPTVSGDTALYPSVLPDVDLSVTVTDQGGFSDVLIVHTPQAAADPRLQTLTMAVATDGLSLQSSNGGMDAVTADGTLAFTAPRPLMWDSATTVSSTPAHAQLSAQPADSGSTGESPTPSSADGPGSAAHVAPVPMETAANALTLTPDASLLNGASTQYPVYIDPYTNPVTGTPGGKYDEVYSNAQCADEPQYQKPQPGGEGVGYQYSGGQCGSGIERSYYSIYTGNLHTGFHIYDSRISISTTFAASWDCNKNQPITLHTTNAIGPDTDWLTRPGQHDTAFPTVSTTVPSGQNGNSNCSNHTATFVVTQQAQTMANGDGDGYDAAGTFGGEANAWTIGLFGNESSPDGDQDYLRMSETLTLTTKFDVPPLAPTSLHTVPTPAGASGPCVEGGDGWIGATTYSSAGSNIMLHSTVTTQISGEKAAAHYSVWDRSVTDPSTGYPRAKSSPDSSYLASGTDAVEPIGFTLLDGHEYGWDVYSQDDSTLHLTSPTSAHCWFKTDFTPPATPMVQNNSSFPPVGSGAANPVVYAGPGKTASFTVTGKDNPSSDQSCDSACLSSGIDHFIWKLDTPPTPIDGKAAQVSSTSADGTATATLPVPVTHWGVHTLFVAGVDAAGNPSTASASYTFTVPWDPDTVISPGDISGDGVPDLLATTKTGDLDMVPGDQDPAQKPAPAQAGPVTTAPQVTGPVTVSTAADSPDGTGWNNYLVTHRGNLHGADVDDLFAYNKTTHQLYVIKNDLDPIDDSATPLVPYSAFGGFVGKRFDVVVKDGCAEADVVADPSRCRNAGYPGTQWNISQVMVLGNVYGNEQGYPAVATVENNRLWLYQSDGGQHLEDPILLGDGDWSGQTLIAPGTVQGTPVLWTRDDKSGTVYSYPLTIDPSTKLPPLLHAPTRTTLVSNVTSTSGGPLCLASPAARTADGTVVIVWGCLAGHAEQEFTFRSDGTVRVLGKCLSTDGGGTANSTLVVIETCDGSAPQKWAPAAGGALMNVSSGRCLADPAADQTPNTQQILWTCGAGGQNWTGGSSTSLPTGTAQSDIGPLLPVSGYPSVASPGDINSDAGPKDGNPDLYAIDANGQLTEYPGSAPTGTTATFSTSPTRLGAITDTANHWWKLNEGAGSTAVDCDGGSAPDCSDGSPITLSGAYAWATDSVRGSVLNLTATTGHGTSAPAVDTSAGFTVSAWARLSSTGANSTFVSQSGTSGYASGFELYYSSGAQAWAFGRHTEDSSSTSYQAVYGPPGTIGQWTHLVGVFDPVAGKLSLYVNGRLAGQQDYTGTDWNAGGAFQIGRRLAPDGWGEYANGEVSDVRTYPTALSPAEAASGNDIQKAVQLD